MNVSKKKTDLNIIAKEISKMEGGKMNLSIAQIKEVMACFGHVLGKRKFIESSVIIYKMIELGFKKKQKHLPTADGF